MNEADIRREVFRMLRLMGYWPITQTDANVCPFCKTIIRPKAGRPDILVMNPTGPSFVVEAKALYLERAKSFRFDEIHEQQRAWMSKWTEDSGVAYIALGTIIPYHRQLWLIPWDYWLETEEIVRVYQDSIPHTAGKGFRTELQEHHLDITHTMEDYECQRQKGNWLCPVLRRE